MNYQEHGFLGDETAEIRAITRKAYAHVFAKCEEVSYLAHRLRNSIKLDYENQLHIVSICLLQRIIDSFQAVVMLMEIGLEADCNTIVRCSLETMLILRKLTEDPDFLVKYVGSEQLHRKKILNAAKADSKSALRRAIKEQALERKLSEITADIKKFNLQEMKIEQLARDVGLDDWYQLTYRFLSSDAHSLPGSLARYVRLDEDLNVTMFDLNPKTDNTKTVLITHCALTLIALDSIEKIFHCGLEKEIDALFQSVLHFE
jgi:hypothetical protein